MRKPVNKNQQVKDIKKSRLSLRGEGKREEGEERRKERRGGEERGVLVGAGGSGGVMGEVRRPRKVTEFTEKVVQYV